MSEKNILDLEEDRMSNPKHEFVDGVEKLEEAIRQVKEAQKKYATYTQEQVDAIFRAAACAADQARIPLAQKAVEETGMGVVEDKVIKNHYAAEYIYNKYRDTKTCGVIEEDKAFGIRKIAEPIGLVAAVIPTTNPTSTAIFKILIALKTRNGIIISPHPRAKLSTIAAAETVLQAAVEAGAPEGIVSWIDVPSLAMTNTLMKEADIILATGGPGMVSAAYSSGKPALGVGAGNTPAIIDDTADIIQAVNSVIHSKTFDNGMICASEQSVIVLDKVYDAVKKEFADRGCYFLNPDETEKVSHRTYCTGFFYGYPGQHYGSSSYSQTADIVAVVEECDAEGNALLTQRNRFFAGDELELMNPETLPVRFVADRITDEDGTEIPDTHRAMMRFRMHLPISVPRYTIIRKNRAN